MGQQWRVNCDISETAYIAHVRKLREEHGYLTFSEPRIGKDRSLSQNQLFHVWCTEYAAHLLKKGKKEITEGELDGMKRAVKRRFYTENPHSFMVHEIINPFTGQTKKDYTSSASWKKGEIFMVMEFMQLTAANDGLVLESIGQFNKNQREQNQ